MKPRWVRNWRFCITRNFSIIFRSPEACSTNHFMVAIHRNLIYIDAYRSEYTFWLLKQWHYNQLQILVLHRYLNHFFLAFCGLFYQLTFAHKFSSLLFLILSSNLIFNFFSIFLDYLWATQIGFKVMQQSVLKIYLLHQTVVPQLSGVTGDITTQPKQEGRPCQWAVYVFLVIYGVNAWHAQARPRLELKTRPGAR
jgi:hypothetical protein